MNKKIRIISISVLIIGLIVSILAIKMSTAQASDTTITGNFYFNTSQAQISYGHSTSKKGYTPKFKVTGIPNDLGGYNAFCLDPGEKAPRDVNQITGHTETYNASGQLIKWNQTSHKYFIYFLYGGPGWDDNKDKIKELFVSNNIMTSTEVKSNDQLYAYTHALIALAYHSAGYQADIGLTNKQITGLQNMQQQLVDYSNNGLVRNTKKWNNLTIYYSPLGSKFQDILFWSYVEPKAYIEIDKEYEPAGTTDPTGRKFRLYEANYVDTDSDGVADSYECVNLLGPVARTDVGNTGYRDPNDGNKYYLGWKRNNPDDPNDYSGQSILDVDKVYCIWESNQQNYTVTYKEKTAGQDKDITKYDTDSSGTYTYAKVDFNDNKYNTYTPGNYTYKLVEATNTGEAKVCINVEKSDSQKPSYSLSGISFSLYEDSTCSGTPKDTQVTNSGGIATFTDLTAATTYYVKETSGDSRYDTSTGPTCTPVTSPAASSTDCETLSVTNTPYKITFYKEDEEGNGLENVGFKVKQAGSNDYITVSARSSDYNNCYVYTGTSSTGSIMKTDSDGQICIARIPGTNGTEYTAYEQASLEGYVFEGGTIEHIKPDTNVKGKVCDSTECNKLINTSVALNFYKVLEDGATKKGGAEFVLSYEDTDHVINYINVKNERSTTAGFNGCYIYDGSTTSKSSASKLISNSDTTSGYDIGVGEVCIVKIPQGTYKVTETKPLDYHTFGDGTTKEITTSSTRQNMVDGNKFPNYKTEFEFTKTVNDEIGYADSIWETMSTIELMKIPFTIYDSNGNPVSVIQTSSGVYEYAGNTVDGVSGTSTTTLYLNNNRKLYVYHLPVGNYTIKEADCCCEDSCQSPSSSECYGFYSPQYGDTPTSYSFTITECSTSRTTGQDELSDNVCPSTSVATQTLDNKPTRVEFTKDDFYSYVNPEDTVKFENEEEISAFDGITFKVYYIENGQKVYVNFAKIGNTGTCKDEDSYSTYRYIPDDMDSSVISGLTITQELHTCGGHIEITHLCRGRKFYIEEVALTGESVFTLPENESDRIKEIDLECCDDGTSEKPSTTVIINDKPTRIPFEKRDSKYGTLINDETTTFEVYRCPQGTECHPGDYTSIEQRKNAGMQLVKFYSRATITGDEEDEGVEVYRMVTNDTNVTDYVTSLHPYYGKLVLRYLQGGYNYVLLETASPRGYSLPRGRNAETAFTVSTTTVEVEEIDVPNKPTSLLIRKYDDEGNLLSGAQFRVYEGTTCAAGVAPKDQPKELLKLKTIRDGVYENREVKDTDKVITCTDKENDKCSDINTALTIDKYVDTWANFDNSVNQNDQRIQIQEGEILIQYLDYGHCYIIEEIKAPNGYSLPEDDNDRFAMVTITKDDDVVDTLKQLVNKPTPFTFYKYDDYNNLIDGGEFKLQKLNDDKKYEDVTVTEEVSEDKLFYKVDPNSTNKTIRTSNGSATIYYLEEGQYRVVETKAPEGMELPNKEINVAVFYVDETGNVIGNSIITNKPKTDKITIKPNSSAELIVQISTGVARLKYGLLIGLMAAVVLGLIIVQVQRKKQRN